MYIYHFKLPYIVSLLLGHASCHCHHPISPETRGPDASWKPLQLSTNPNYPGPIKQGTQEHTDHQSTTLCQESHLQKRGL